MKPCSPEKQGVSGCNDRLAKQSLISSHQVRKLVAANPELGSLCLSRLRTERMRQWGLQGQCVRHSCPVPALPAARPSRSAARGRRQLTTKAVGWVRREGWRTRSLCRRRTRKHQPAYLHAGPGRHPGGSARGAPLAADPAEAGAGGQGAGEAGRGRARARSGRAAADARREHAHACCIGVCTGRPASST